MFQLYHGENSLVFDEMLMRSALYWTNTLSWVVTVLAYSRTVRGQTFLPTWTHYPDSEPTSLCPLCCVLRGEATHTICIVFLHAINGQGITHNKLLLIRSCFKLSFTSCVCGILKQLGEATVITVVIIWQLDLQLCI
jgi:hypothetical protein